MCAAGPSYDISLRLLVHQCLLSNIDSNAATLVLACMLSASWVLWGYVGLELLESRSQMLSQAWLVHVRTDGLAAWLCSFIVLGHIVL